jgi:sulfonate transport system substrate-binding protein
MRQPSRLFLLLILGLLLLPMAPVSADDSAMPEKLRVTYVKLPLNVPAVIVKHQAMLEKEFDHDGISITWPEITSGGKQTQALAAGSIDIASVVSSTAAITARANGADLKIVAVFARAPKAFNVMAVHPEITTVKDLKGRKVGGPKGSLLNQTLFAALMDNGLHPDDVGYVHMGVPKAMAAMIGGSLDAALIAGPFVPKAESQGARIIASGEGLVKGLIVTAVNASFLNQHPDLVRRYLAVQKKALAFCQDNPEKMFAIVARETGLEVKDVKRMYPWYDFDPAIQESDMKDLEMTQQFLVESGMLEKPTDIGTLVADLGK